MNVLILWPCSSSNQNRKEKCHFVYVKIFSELLFSPSRVVIVFKWDHRYEELKPSINECS